MNMSDDLPIKHGSEAEEIYVSVGLALSFWESSEDYLNNLFAIICGGEQPIAIETFCVAPRESREKMLFAAIEQYSSKLVDGQAKTIQAAWKALKRLASTRNQIAHGSVASISGHESKGHTLEGDFLVSTFDPFGHFSKREDNFKYALTAKEIDDWRDEVRVHRGTIMDATHDILGRNPISRSYESYDEGS